MDDDERVTYFRRIDAPELLADERKKHPPFVAFAEIRPQLGHTWRIKGLLPRRGIGAVYGPSGSGKTFVLLDMLMAVARGVPWRGRKTERTGVLYLCPDGGWMVQNRVEAYRLRHSIGAADIVLAPAGVDLLGQVSPEDVAAVQRLIGFLEQLYDLRVGIVVVDTVSRAMPGGDENAAKDVTRLIENLAHIAGGDRLVLGVHHTPKSDAKTLRGHSALHGACDVELNITDRAITVAKQRDGETGLVLGFGLEVVEIGRDEDDEPVTSCVVTSADAPPVRGKGGRAELSDVEAVALDTVANLIATQGAPLPQGQGFPTGGQRHGIPSKAVLAELMGSIYGGKKPEPARSCWWRLQTKLQRKGLLGVCKSIVWLP